MTLDDLSVNFEHLDSATLLQDWHWLLDAEMLPVLVTLSGDVFVQDSRDGSVHFLDTVEGQLDCVADSGDEFSELLKDQEFVMERFAVHLIAPLVKAGKAPTDGRVFSFKHPPALGGDYDRDNLDMTDIEVHFSLTGQTFEQINDLPDGTPISEVKIKIH